MSERLTDLFTLQGRSLAFVMRAFTLRSAERQVELQEAAYPASAAGDLSINSGGISTNEHLPAATQVHSALSPGWIGLTILVPLVLCFISAGVFRTIWRTREPGSSEASNAASMALASGATNSASASAKKHHHEHNNWKVPMEIAAVVQEHSSKEPTSATPAIGEFEPNLCQIFDASNDSSH